MVFVCLKRKCKNAVQMCVLMHLKSTISIKCFFFKNLTTEFLFPFYRVGKTIWNLRNSTVTSAHTLCFFVAQIHLFDRKYHQWIDIAWCFMLWADIKNEPDVKPISPIASCYHLLPSLYIHHYLLSSQTFIRIHEGCLRHRIATRYQQGGIWSVNQSVKCVRLLMSGSHTADLIKLRHRFSHRPPIPIYFFCSHFAIKASHRYV